MPGRKRNIQLEETGIADHGRLKVSGLLRKLLGGGEDQVLVGGLVVGGAGLDVAHPVYKAHHGGHVKHVLIESAEIKNPVLHDRAAQGEAELLLAIVRLEVHERLLCVEAAVAEVIKSAAMSVIGA